MPSANGIQPLSPPPKICSFFTPAIPYLTSRTTDSQIPIPIPTPRPRRISLRTSCGIQFSRRAATEVAAGRDAAAIIITITHLPEVLCYAFSMATPLHSTPLQSTPVPTPKSKPADLSRLIISLTLRSNSVHDNAATETNPQCPE